MKFIIFGKDFCSFCRSAVSHCKRKGYEYEYHKLESEVTKEEVVERIGRDFKTVPQIIKIEDDGTETYVGGCDELKANF